MSSAEVDSSFRVQPIAFPGEIELFNLKLARFQPKAGGEIVNSRFEDRKTVTAGRDVTADPALPRIHRPFDRDFSGKVSGLRSEEAGKLAQIVDRARNIAPEIWSQPFVRL